MKVMHFETCRLWLAMCVVLAVSCNSLLAEMVLVEAGKPNAVMIVAQQQKQATEAANVIADIVEQISGARLPIITEGQVIPDEHPIRIWVGHSKRASSLGVTIPSGYDPAPRKDAFNEEGFVLRSIGNELFVGGNQDGPYRGTIYGAYRLLEQLGCRWFFPGKWGQVIPQSKTVSLKPMNITSKPDFAVRDIWLSGWIPTSTDERKAYMKWGEKIGFNHAKFYPTVGDGFLGFLLPPGEYFQEHPEYFAMDKKGKRMVHSKMYERHAMLCLPNPDVLKESIANLKDAFAGQRKMVNVASNGLGISPPDGAPYCFCEEFPMQSMNISVPRYVHGKIMSDEFFSFAADLARVFPDKYVSTMAYSNRIMPPLNVDIPENIMVLLAPISADVLHDNSSPYWRRQELVKIVKTWLKKTPHVVMYDYNPGLLTGMFVPERDVANSAVNIPMYHKMGLKGMSREGRKAFMQTWISYYITAKLLWDADADVDALKQEFYSMFFGDQVGPYVQAWWDACEQKLDATTTQAHEDFLINHVYDVAFVQKIRKHLEHAYELSMAHATTEQQERLKVVLLIADHLMAYAKMTQAESQMNWVLAEQHALEMFELKKQLHEASTFLMQVETRFTRPYFAEGRAKVFAEHQARFDGKVGNLVTALPRTMKFQRDRYDEGIIGEWFKADTNDADWQTRDSFLLWDQQEEPLTSKGHDYDGYAWYRTRFEVDASKINKTVQLYLGGIINEGWVWVNGQFAGHKKHDLWWSHNNHFQVDVTDLIRPGKPNQMTIRVYNDADVGGLFRRGYLWSPVESEKAQ